MSRLAVDRLQEQLRSASDDVRLDSYAARRDLGRFDDGQRYPRDDDRLLRAATTISRPTARRSLRHLERARPSDRPALKSPFRGD